MRRTDLVRERAEAERRLETLAADLAAVKQASEGSNADDEHDPEGATIAFEREQLSALVRRARQRVLDLDAALHRLDAGTYARCRTCGSTIPTERLEALPATQTCRDCA
ncbi:TraR/DksA C4-type zinc finger protein [Aeromicrobium halocynthiae]|uniref:TraR/DksA C4-type zinc finger protein n=1 Tax=Aeromicrobium halocynthiae TaxID=560557 RepID=A0ABP5HQM4_9ACTN